MNNETKAVVTVSEMARMVGLSRARFYQLVRGGTFPPPVYDSGRPVYTEELQQVCLDVQRKHRGIDGQPVLFYARRLSSAQAKSKVRLAPALPAKNRHIDALVDGLNALGLPTAKAAEVESVTRELYPNGTAGIDQAEVLRAVFLAIRRRNSTDKVHR